MGKSAHGTLTMFNSIGFCVFIYIDGWLCPFVFHIELLSTLSLNCPTMWLLTTYIYKTYTSLNRSRCYVFGSSSNRFQLYLSTITNKCTGKMLSLRGNG